MYYLTVLSTFGSYATHLAIPMENMFYGKREEEICEKLKIISDIFATKLNYIPDYKSRRTKYLQRTVFLFVFDIALAYTSVFVTLRDLDDLDPSDGMVMIGIVILRVRWCQIALFLDVISDFLYDLHTLLKQQQIQSLQGFNDCRRNELSCQRIQYFRDIYSNIWHITTLFSDCFGWSLIAFLIKVELELINGAYWFYINLRLHESISLNIGEILLFWKHYINLFYFLNFSDIFLFNSSLVVVFCYFCLAAERCQNMGKAVSKALHKQSNFHDSHYQRHIRLFSLQLKQLPIKMMIKELFVFNYTMLKSVGWKQEQKTYDLLLNKINVCAFIIHIHFLFFFWFLDGVPYVHICGHSNSIPNCRWKCLAGQKSTINFDVKWIGFKLLSNPIFQLTQN